MPVDLPARVRGGYLPREELAVARLQLVARDELRVQPGRDRALEIMLQPPSAPEPRGEAERWLRQVGLDHPLEKRPEPAARPGPPLARHRPPAPCPEQVGQEDVRVLEELVAAVAVHGDACAQGPGPGCERAVPPLVEVRVRLVPGRRPLLLALQERDVRDV